MQSNLDIKLGYFNASFILKIKKMSKSWQLTMIEYRIAIMLSCFEYSYFTLHYIKIFIVA